MSVFIARDLDGSLWCFEYEPSFHVDEWIATSGFTICMDDDQFPKVAPGECKAASIILDGPIEPLKDDGRVPASGTETVASGHRLFE